MLKSCQGAPRKAFPIQGLEGKQAASVVSNGGLHSEDRNHTLMPCSTPCTSTRVMWDTGAMGDRNCNTGSERSALDMGSVNAPVPHVTVHHSLMLTMLLATNH